MRTVVLSLGLALLCLLRAEAGAAGLDRSKVTCSTPGEGSVVSGHQGGGRSSI